MHERSFTLIELLVVAAVIAIIAAMAFPALGLSRRQARTTACMNNIRQISWSYTEYLNTFNHTPPVWQRSGKRWMDLLGNTGCLSADGQDSSSIWHCPGDFRSRKKKEIDSDGKTYLLSYGINQSYSRHEGFQKTPYLLWSGLASGAIADPSGFITAADAVNYYIGKDKSDCINTGIFDNEKIIPDGRYGYLSWRHNNGFNAAFADGHAEYISGGRMQPDQWDFRGSL